MTYFELFDLPLRAVADKTHVAKTYLALQRKYHPDYFAGASEHEQENMMQLSADVNKAYKVFMDDDATLAYFLEQNGTIEQDEKYALPPDFLMDMMEINEGMDEGDPEQTAVQIATLQNALQAEVAPVLAKETVSLTADDLARLKAYYYKKKYLARITERLDGDET